MVNLSVYLPSWLPVSTPVGPVVKASRLDSYSWGVAEREGWDVLGWILLA